MQPITIALLGSADPEAPPEEYGRPRVETLQLAQALRAIDPEPLREVKSPFAHTPPTSGVFPLYGEAKWCFPLNVVMPTPESFGETTPDVVLLMPTLPVTSEWQAVVALAVEAGALVVELRSVTPRPPHGDRWPLTHAILRWSKGWLTDAAEVLEAIVPQVGSTWEHRKSERRATVCGVGRLQVAIPGFDSRIEIRYSEVPGEVWGRPLVEFVERFDFQFGVGEE